MSRRVVTVLLVMAILLVAFSVVFGAASAQTGTATATAAAAGAVATGTAVGPRTLPTTGGSGAEVALALMAVAGLVGLGGGLVLLRSRQAA